MISTETFTDGLSWATSSTHHTVYFLETPSLLQDHTEEQPVFLFVVY